MDPLTLGAIFGGVGLLNELTTGRERQQRDAQLKAEAYRVSPWMQSRPETFQIREANPLGAAAALGLGGAQLGSGLAKQSAYEAYLSGLAKKGQLELPPDFVESNYSMSSQKRSPWLLMG